MGAKDDQYHILWAEDDPDDQCFLQGALQEALPLVRLALVNNGEEAISHLKENEELPDIFITDINMPKMTGYEALSCLRTELDLRSLQVVIFSTEEQDFMRCIDLHIAFYINKPCEFKGWVEELKQLDQLLTWARVLKARLT